jgi:hypothetical protein
LDAIEKWYTELAVHETAFDTRKETRNEKNEAELRRDTEVTESQRDEEDDTGGHTRILNNRRQATSAARNPTHLSAAPSTLTHSVTPSSPPILL